MSAVNWSNADAMEAFEAEQLEDEQTERRQRRDVASLQQRIERQLAEEFIGVPVGGERIAFRPFGREASQFAAVMDEHLSGLDASADIEAEFDDAVDRMYAIAAEYSQPEWATMDWWERNFSIPRIIAILHFVNVEGEAPDEVDVKK